MEETFVSTKLKEMAYNNNLSKNDNNNNQIQANNDVGCMPCHNNEEYLFKQSAPREIPSNLK